MSRAARTPVNLWSSARCLFDDDVVFGTQHLQNN